MAEFLYNDIQLIQPGADAIFEQNIGCNRGNIIFRPQTSQILLRGSNPNSCNKFARYQVTFNGNIAVPATGTAGEIGMALTINGGVIPTSRALVTPAAVDEYFNVTCTSIIDIPCYCCQTLGVKNVTVSPTPATTPAQAINLQNANLVVNRIA